MESTEACMEVYSKIIDANPLLGREDELALVKIMRKFKSGEKRTMARDKIINSNLRLVIKQAVYYSRHSYNTGLEDLIGAGMEGLCMAVDRFDPRTYKTKFSTYAIPWIKVRILRLLTNCNSTVYVPRHILEQAHKYRKSPERAILTDEDLMKELNVTEKGLRNIRMSQTHTVSLSASRYTEDDGGKVKEIGDEIADVRAVIPEKTLVDKETRTRIEEEVAKLRPIEAAVISRRYLSGVKEDLKDIGKSLHVTGERVRQIEVMAMRKLRRRMKSRTHFGV